VKVLTAAGYTMTTATPEEAAKVADTMKPLLDDWAKSRPEGCEALRKSAPRWPLTRERKRIAQMPRRTPSVFLGRRSARGRSSHLPIRERSRSDHHLAVIAGIFTRYVFSTSPSRIATRSAATARDYDIRYLSVCQANNAFHSGRLVQARLAPAGARSRGHFDVLAFGLAGVLLWHFVGSSSRRIASASALRRFPDAALACRASRGNRRVALWFLDCPDVPSVCAALPHAVADLSGDWSDPTANPDRHVLFSASGPRAWRCLFAIAVPASVSADHAASRRPMRSA